MIEAWTTGGVIPKHHGPCDVEGSSGKVKIDFMIGIPRNCGIAVTIDNEGFEEMAQAMMRADPVAAIKAFGAALQTVEAVTQPSEASAA